MKKTILISVTVIVIVFLGWRLVRPMQIFVVSPAFERPIDTTQAPAMFPTLSADECKTCHQEFYKEWSTTIHSQAWTDPYFQVDWHFDGSPQICKNCHIPLDRQQEHKVIGFNDDEKWDPILEPNPKFDTRLQHEGVTCNVCHLRDGKILGIYGNTSAPHPVEKLENPNQICIRCHVVSGERWDTFYKVPPCGTVAEIRADRNNPFSEESTKMSIEEISSLDCVGCHMPLLERPMVSGGKTYPTRQHLWRGGHDPEKVKQGLTITFKEAASSGTDKRNFTLTISNSGSAHYIPTGTPDRHLTIRLRAKDIQGNVLNEKQFILKRTTMWRPFIVDLWDTRLHHDEQREYTLAVSEPMLDTTAKIEAEVRYHLLDEARRKRIGYNNREPISYPVFQQQLRLARFAD